MVRQELGPRLGQFLQLENNQGPKVQFREHIRDASGTADVQRRFFQFLDSVVRNAAHQVEVEIVERQNPPMFGQAFAPRQILDLADLEAIPQDSQAFSRVLVITHEIAERLWLVMHGYVHRAVLDEVEILAWTILWFEPAHEYALRRESEVTGWRRGGEASRSGVPALIAQNHLLLQLFESMFWGVGGAPVEVDFTYIRSRRSSSYPSMRRTHILFVGGALGSETHVQEVEVEVPVSGRVPGPLGQEH